MPRYEMNWKCRTSHFGEVEAENEDEAKEKVLLGLIIDPDTDPESKIIKNTIKCAGEIT